MPHGSKPNESSVPRMAMFVKFFPAFDPKEERIDLIMHKVKKTHFDKNLTGIIT